MRKILANKKECIGLAIISFLITVITLILFKDTIFYENKEIVNLDLTDDVEMFNCRVLDNTIITENEDPQLIFHNLPNELSNYIDIQLKDPAKQNLDIQLYYSENGDSFDEQYSITKEMNIGDMGTIIDYPAGKYAAIRLDIGNVSGLTYSLESVTLNNEGSAVSGINDWAEIIFIGLMLLISIFIILLSVSAFILKFINNKCDKRNTILLLVLSCLISVISLIGLEKTLFYNDKPVYRVDLMKDVEYTNVHFQSQNIVTDNDDPQMLLKGMSKRATNKILISFQEPLQQDLVIQLFFGTEEGFSETNSISGVAQRGTTEFALQFPNGQYENMRLDIGNKADLIYNIKLIELCYEGMNISGGSELLLLFLTGGVIFVGLFIGISYGLRKLELFFDQLDERKEKIVLIILMIFAFVFTFQELFKGMIISPTNFMYHVHPWVSNNTVRTIGPFLSDQADSGMPGLYQVIQNGFHFWSSYNVFGSISNTYIYCFDYFRLLILLFFSFGTTIATVAQYAIAFIGMFLLLKDFKCNKYACYIGGMVFCFSSAIVMWGQWDHSTIISLSPYLLLFIHRYIEREKIVYLFPFIFSLIMMFAANMIAYVGYFLYLTGCYVLYQVWLNRKDKRKMIYIITGFFVAVVIGVATSFFFYSELFQSVLNSGYLNQRMAKNYNQLILPVEYIKEFFNPYVSISGAHINEREVFTGITSILLFCIPFVSRHKKQENQDYYFWRGIGVLLLIILFTHIFDPLIGFLPVINTSPKPRLIALLNFVLAVIAGFVVNGLEEGKFIIDKKSIARFCFLCFCILIYYLYSVGITGGIRTFIYNFINMDNSNDVYFGVLLLLFGILLIFMYRIRTGKNTYFIKLLLCVVTSFEMGYFASNYIPYIEKTDSIIPKDHEVVDYLRNHMNNMNRMSSIGTWNLTANMNLYYDLHNIRGHSFVNTNQDVNEFITRIDENAFVTSTFTSFSKQVNYNLLGYSSVKYFLRDPEEGIMNSNKRKNGSKGTELTARIQSNYLVEGKFLVLKVNRDGVGSIIRLENENQTLFEHVITEDDYVNDNVIYVKLNGSVNLKDNAEILLHFTLNNDLVYGVLEDGSLDAALYQYPLEYIDGYFIEEIPSNERALLTRNIELVKDDETVLNNMSEKFIPDKVYVTEQEFTDNQMKLPKQKAMKDGEGITAFEDSGDEITIKAKLDAPAWLMLTDYYHKDWEVYVNGQKTDISRVNYLFRGVQIQETGEVTIQFVFNTNFYKISAIISSVFGAVAISLFAVRKRIQKMINKYLDKSKNNGLTKGAEK